MGKKKKSSTNVFVTTTTKTKLIKLTYLQTLAVVNDLAKTKDLQTSSKEASANLGGGGKESLGSALTGGLIGSKKKVSSTTDQKSTGNKVKDEWLQPEFDRVRYAIGIRELTAASYKFAKKSELVSVPYLSPKEIVKVHVVVDQYIPPQFDQNLTWIEYYIRVEGTEEWIRINPLNNPTKFDDQGAIIPKIINFNLAKPATAQLEDKYQTTEDPVKKLRFRALLTRPGGGNNEAMTPLLKSYRMIMTPRQ